MKISTLILTLMLCLMGGTATAETRYASDQLEVPMRSGKGTKFRILRMLPSGTALQVLGKDASSGYTKVRATGGVEGWVLTRYIMNTPSARDRLAAAEKKLAHLELENRKLTSSFGELETQKGSTDEQVASLTQSNHRLSQELDELHRTASSALAIDAENKSLKTHIATYERKLQALQQENEGLKDRTARDWFMVGAGVVILGMIIGLIIPRIRWKKKSSWDTL